MPESGSLTQRRCLLSVLSVQEQEQEVEVARVSPALETDW